MCNCLQRMHLISVIITLPCFVFHHKNAMSIDMLCEAAMGIPGANAVGSSSSGMCRHSQSRQVAKLGCARLLTAVSASCSPKPSCCSSCTTTSWFSAGPLISVIRAGTAKVFLARCVPCYIVSLLDLYPARCFPCNIFPCQMFSLIDGLLCSRCGVLWLSLGLAVHSSTCTPDKGAPCIAGVCKLTG